MDFHFILLGGRRGNVTLGHVLGFVSGADEEPCLGYSLDPRLVFRDAINGNFIPTASTCINQLVLPCLTINVKLPDDSALFNLYDFAFVNSYFGMI